MNGRRPNALGVLALVTLLSAAEIGRADPTINLTNRFAYGANLGWIDWRPTSSNGVSCYITYCTGMIYTYSTGWISVGSGTPTNGFTFSNQTTNDFGVNLDDAGHLRGFAYGANIGWVVFETNGNPRLDYLTGNLSGYAWGANVGWISLSNAGSYLQTDRLDPGPDADGDAMPDAWELARTGRLDLLALGADRDHDGMHDEDEYTAGTDPLDGGDLLAITAIAVDTDATVHVTWRSHPNRVYQLQMSTNLTHAEAWAPASPDWHRAKVGPHSTTTCTNSMASGSMRIDVRVPLQSE